MASSSNKPKLVVNGKRVDGRGFDEIRKLKIVASPLRNADGSAYIEWGNNKILAAVYGPREATPRHLSNPTRAIIKCKYSMAPFSSLSEHGRTGPNRRSTEISKVIKEVFENVVTTSDFPGSEIAIFIEILQGDGGTRAAGITAASVALASAGIHMKDLPYALSVGRIDEHIALDFDMIEDNYSDSDMPIAISPRNNEILLLQMDGGMTREQISKALKLAIEKGVEVSAIQKAALKDAYASSEKAKE